MPGTGLRFGSAPTGPGVALVLTAPPEKAATLGLGSATNPSLSGNSAAILGPCRERILLKSFEECVQSRRQQPRTTRPLDAVSCPTWPRSGYAGIETWRFSLPRPARDWSGLGSPPEAQLASTNSAVRAACVPIYPPALCLSSFFPWPKSASAVRVSRSRSSLRMSGSPTATPLRDFSAAISASARNR